MAYIRLNKLIADSGLASRRQADRWIEEGLVSLNGKKVYELGVKVDPSHDSVKVKGRLLPTQQEKHYIMVNKPKGVLTSTSDPEDRPVITEIVKQIPARLFPVGRLDWDTEGMILMTNDGEFANRITHPKNEITKTYLVKVEGDVSQEKLDKLKKGVSIVGGRVRAKGVEPFKRQMQGKYSWVKIIITEGKNRQVRKMFEKIKCDVLKLQRVAIGTLRLGSLKKGSFKHLNPNQIRKLFTPDEILGKAELAAKRKKKRKKR